MVFFSHGACHLIHDSAVDANEIIFSFLAFECEFHIAEIKVIDVVPEGSRCEF